jgi:hypothetical protein
MGEVLSSRSLAELVIARDLISLEQLELAVAEEMATGKRLSDVFVEQGLISKPTLREALLVQLDDDLQVEEPPMPPDLESLSVELFEETFDSTSLSDVDHYRDAASERVGRDPGSASIENGDVTELRAALEELRQMFVAMAADVEAIRDATRPAGLA